MDLRTCPACNQSVLDDDAELCPFCGAAMDGSSTSTKAPSSAKSPKAIAREKAEREAADAKTATKTKPARPADDDPFAVAPQKKSKAIPLRRKPTAKTTYRVVCPMCDTNGFATPAVAGKEVKCPNPKCLMPIFTAPEIKKEAPPEPKKSLFTPLNLALVGVLLVAIGGGLFYAFVLNEPEQEVKVDPLNPLANVPKEETTPDNNTQPETNDPPPPPKISIPELESNILTSGVEAARQRDNNRSKDLCRILTASAYAESDQLEDAFGQLQAFDNLNTGVDFMKIAPLCRVAWEHLASGDRGAAEKVADQAVEFSARLPRQGDDAVQQSIALGTLLVALGRYEDARELVSSRESVQQVAQAVARISMVIQDDSFNLARSFRWLPQVELDSPLAFAISYGATVRGYADQAAECIQQMNLQERKSICLAGYAAGLGMRGENSPAEIITKIESFSDLPAQDRQRALGLVLQVVQLNNKKGAPAVADLQSHLQTAVDGNEVSSPSELPDFRGVYEGTFSGPPAETKLNIQLHLLLGHSLAEAGNTEAAWNQIEQALAETAAIAPPKRETTALVEEVERGRDRIQSRLAREYDISRTDLQRSAFNQYRKNAREIETASQRRYEQEERILNLALRWGLVNELYAHYQEQAKTAADSNFVQIVEADIMADLIFALNESGQAEAGQTLASKWGVDVSKSSQLSSERQMRRLVQSGRSQEAFQFYNRNRATLEQPLLFLELSCLMAEDGELQNIFDWIGLVPDPVEKELCYRLASAQLTHRGLLRETWKVSQNRNLSATERCSLNLGLLEGLHTTDQYQPPVPPPSPDQKKPGTAQTSVN